MPVRTIADRYELIEEIGSGGMGTIWRGYDSVLDREVAVKAIRPDMLLSPEHIADLAERFRREARVTARIQHHGVPQVYDAVLDADSADRLYLVMQYIQGRNLRSYIDPADPLPIAWAAATGAQIATVLSHAHAIPVVHRDLKPDNVLVTGDGTVKVLDFGIAAILRRDITKITVTGVPLGTSPYMSPEQVNAAQVTPQSDLYGLGCVLHELLAGTPVFNGSSQYELWKQHITAAPEPLRRLRPDVPPELEELVLALLAKKPEQRPADAYAVYERLLPFLPSPGSPALPTSPRLGEMPDPTLLYRQPNAPRRRTSRQQPPVPTPPTVPHAPTTPPPQLRNAIDEALKHSTELLGSGRYAQAADVVEAVIGPAAKMLGSESPDLLKLRFHRALILYLGGDSRTALPEFDALADAYARTAGPSSDRALKSRRYAALCRANLGRNTVALDQFRQLLDDVAAIGSHASELALDIRHSIGMLLLAADDKAAAENAFEALYQDHLVINGPSDERTREIADILQRIRLRTSD
ncbi:serine/threonine-protein kinase [Actinomadura sp. 7K534]|uniref:serine/threonine-protein kinase n=1 Tax=Actinomadura sp. 7K534 TaxID=2530366 RepID=UPI00104D3946|nr:serine/threonine-protein kinase [Actinomadura sp. 7K534]TDB95697.1 serine/threonine protein kinase [Actinomadura sp. 7K534]